MQRSRETIDKGTLTLVIVLSLAALAFTILASGFTLDNGVVYGAF